jgi:hypothetical protein
MMETVTYTTHDNGATPFEITITDKHINIHSNYHMCDDISYDAINILIGKSYKNKMTEISGYIGDEYDGNSVLVHIYDNTYVFIGFNIFTFTSLCKIIDFVSPIGNNDVPYPYAIDIDGNIYLLLENVILMNTGNLQSKLNDYDDPYSYYYHYEKFVNVSGAHNLTNHMYSYFDNINEFFIDDDPYTLSYQSDAKNHYDNIIPHVGNTMYVKYSGDNAKYELTKDQYIDIMKRYGEMAGFEHIANVNIIVDRSM